MFLNAYIVNIIYAINLNVIYRFLSLSLSPINLKKNVYKYKIIIIDT